MFDWNDYYKLADSLAKASDEASQRCAISRAYYAAYHCARIYLQNSGAVIPKGVAAHEEVWRQLQGFSDKNLVHAGVNGDRLRIERNRADYEADLKNVANMTMPALFKSKAVLKYLR